MSLFNGIPYPIGSEEWIQACEKAEWAFVAQMLLAADSELSERGFHLSGLKVAWDIAIARSVHGWRTYQPPESETSGTDTKTNGTP